MRYSSPKSWIVMTAIAMSACGARAEVVTISIKNYVFGNNNAVVTVKVNDTVRWVNDDLDAHTVTSGPNRTADGKFDSGFMDSSAVFEHTFTTAGDYPYYCDYHVGMESTIKVQEGGATVTIDISGFSFGNDNAPVEINVGDTVIWRNLDTGITHTVTSGTRGSQNAGQLFDHSFAGNATNPPTFPHTFMEPGEYPYFCRPHGGMNSSIVVKSTTPIPVRGDINGDGAVDSTDVMKCLRVLCGVDMLPHGSLTRMDVAPTNGDATFDMQDVLRITRFVAATDTAPL